MDQEKQKSPFEIGDIVMVKGLDGPKMVVTDPDGGYEEEEADVRWFRPDGECTSDRFPWKLLEKVS